MQFSLYTNQAKAIEWGISLSHAVLFGFIFDRLISQKQDTWVDISERTILYELPILLIPDKKHIVTRLSADLERAGLLEYEVFDRNIGFKLTSKGREWSDK